METPGLNLSEHLRVLEEIVARVPGGMAGLTAATDSDVVALVAAAAALSRSVESVLVTAAGEVARRSPARQAGSLARQHGERNARFLVARLAHVSIGEASRLVEVGEAVRPRVALSGEDLPAEREHLASAVNTGTISSSVARLIDQTITGVEGRLLRDGAAVLEGALVETATRCTVAEFVRACQRVPNAIDPDGAADRDKDLRGKASITEVQLPDGMLRVTATLDPERAAYYLAAVRARTNPRKQDPESSSSKAAGSRWVQPTPAESKLDAFVGILRDSLKADQRPTAGVDTTVIVRIDLDDLLGRLESAGIATIDDSGQQISASTARRMAADAGIIPQVLGGESQVLDQGTSKRVFTKAQRYAILAAYSGCAFPGCGIPSSMVEMHHVHPWKHRERHRHATDLENGMPLCGFHNRLMDDDSRTEDHWDIEFDDDRVPWFIPPRTVDFARTPRRAGNLVRDLRAA